MPSRSASAHRRHLWLSAAFCVAVASSCGWRDQSPTASLEPPADLAQHLTGEAALALNDRGEFRFAGAMAPAGVPIITEARARELAVAWLQNWRSLLQRPMERDRGEAIDWDRLRPGRVFFARTPYAPVPDRYHQGIRNHLGPRHVIVFQNGSEPVLVVSVAAYATEAWLDEQGRMLTPVQHGNEVLVFALSPSATTGRGFQPNLPEQAAARIGRATGAKTVHVPELVLQGDSTYLLVQPALSLWRVRLDRDIGVRRREGLASVMAVREIFVGANGTAYIPRAEQAGQIAMDAPLRQGPGEDRRSEPMVLATLPPVLFEEVTLDQEGQ